MEAYLRDSGKFSYTLEMNVSDRNIDPVLDFLTNRKKGHCEYFASGTLPAAPIRRHSRADRQRVQGRRLERADTVDERPPEARS